MEHGAARPLPGVPWGRGLWLAALCFVLWVLIVAPGGGEGGTHPAPRNTAADSPPAAPVVAAPPPVASALPPASSAALLPPPAPAQPEPAPPEVKPCPAEMVPVIGSYCTAVEHTCKRWLDDDILPFARCAEYEPPARCVGKRQELAFCIDEREYTEPGEKLPKNYASFTVASRTCERLGKRVCTESEWNFACEGPDSLPYPYGWTREPVCNQDRRDLYEPGKKKQTLRDHRVPAGSMPGCVSPFGVFDMTGNLDEPVLREARRWDYPFRNALKGGWWMAGRNRCRAATTAHNDHYKDIQIGIRCCRDLEDTGASEAKYPNERQ